MRKYSILKGRQLKWEAVFSLCLQSFLQDLAPLKQTNKPQEVWPGLGMRLRLSGPRQAWRGRRIYFYHEVWRATPTALPRMGSPGSALNLTWHWIAFQGPVGVPGSCPQKLLRRESFSWGSEQAELKVTSTLVGSTVHGTKRKFNGHVLGTFDCAGIEGGIGRGWQIIEGGATGCRLCCCRSQ